MLDRDGASNVTSTVVIFWEYCIIDSRGAEETPEDSIWSIESNLRGQEATVVTSRQIAHEGIK